VIKQTLKYLAIAAIFSSCNQTTDTENPTVQIESPAEGQVVSTNDDLRLVATLSDDTGLLQYKLTINGIDSLNDVASDSTLHFIYVEGVLNETKAIYLDETIVLVDSTFNGHYYATLTAIDIEGNESVRDTVKFKIRNSIDSEIPVFNVGGPVAGDTLTFGEGFSVTGSVTDSQSLIYADIYVGRTDLSFELLSFGFADVQNNIVDYGNVGWFFQVDSTWSQGAYHMYFTAWDNYSGVSHEIPFYVSY
jgi:hypothetical protein